MLEESRVRSALIVAVVGLIIPAALSMFFVANGWKANDVSTVVGLFTSVVGTAGQRRAYYSAVDNLGNIS